jgi:hypothetical protein
LRVAITVDNLLCDTDSLKEDWIHFNGGETKFLTAEPFWGALKPYEDVGLLTRWAQTRNHDLYVLAERPKALFMVTRAWLRNKCGLVVDKDHLIMQTIPRYDCRVNEIDLLISASPSMIENLKIETVRPVSGYLVDRASGDGFSRLLEGLA